MTKVCMTGLIEFELYVMTIRLLCSEFLASFHSSEHVLCCSAFDSVKIMYACLVNCQSVQQPKSVEYIGSTSAPKAAET
jgi:hypothetical protein